MVGSAARRRRKRARSLPERLGTPVGSESLRSASTRAAWSSAQTWALTEAREHHAGWSPKLPLRRLRTPIPATITSRRRSRNACCSARSLPGSTTAGSLNDCSSAAIGAPRCDAERRQRRQRPRPRSCACARRPCGGARREPRLAAGAAGARPRAARPRRPLPAPRSGCRRRSARGARRAASARARTARRRTPAPPRRRRARTVRFSESTVIPTPTSRVGRKLDCIEHKFCSNKLRVGVDSRAEGDQHDAGQDEQSPTC